MLKVYTSIDMLGRGRLLAHFKRLDADALRRRFHGAYSETSLGIYVARAEPVLLVAYEDDGCVRGIVEVCPGDEVSEAALSIEAGWRGVGLGHDLFEAALMSAHALGVGAIELFVTSHNSAMLSLSRSFGGAERMVEAGLIRSCVETRAVAAA